MEPGSSIQPKFWWKLVVLGATFFMFGKFLVHVKMTWTMNEAI